ncbi:MAG: carboxypeptidase-like regulatory domain-containing protein, partial [Rhodothermus sp.]|nr:carboxypeptidase-like regulatory domain-containing protein [Rhodothermus sp.]
MRTVSGLCLLALSWLSLSVLLPADYQITGTIIYGPSFPLEGAQVYALEPTGAETLATGVTDASGSFALTLPAGTAVDPQPSTSVYRITALYPQPMLKELRLQVHYTAPSSERVPPVPEIFDITGRQIPPEAPRTAGVYFLRLRFASGHYTPPRSFVQTTRGIPSITLWRSPPIPIGAGQQHVPTREIRLRIVHPHFASSDTVYSLHSGTPLHIETALTPIAALLTPTLTQPRHLLFTITAPSALEAYYFGMQQNDSLLLTHLLLQQGMQLQGVVFNESHHPIQWIG